MLGTGPSIFTPTYDKNKLTRLLTNSDLIYLKKKSSSNHWIQFTFYVYIYTLWCNGGICTCNIKLSSYQYGEPHVKDKTVFILRQGPAYFRHTYVDLWYSLYEPHMNTRQRIVVSKTLAILSIVAAFETGIIKIAVNMKRGLGIYFSI